MRIARIMQPRRPAGKRRTAILAAATVLCAAPLAAVQAAFAFDAPSGSAQFSVAPVEGRLTSAYGERTDPIDGKAKFHKGVDVAAPKGTEIHAPAAGTVVRAEFAENYGNVVDVDHGDGYVTRYGQVSAFKAAVGDKVRAGDAIALVGSSGRSTGPHLHLEVLKDGENIDPASVLDLPSKG